MKDERAIPCGGLLERKTKTETKTDLAIVFAAEGALE